jgi:hypothetical protein
MSDRLAVTLTVDELVALVVDGVRAALVGREAIDRRVSDLAAEEMTVGDVVALFHLSPKSGPKTIYRWRRDRAFPAPHRRGNRVRYLRSEVDVWRAQQGTSGAGAVTPPGRGRKTEEGAATAARAHH